jgi:drug/metabolite transporter (DMT)-like permease
VTGGLVWVIVGLRVVSNPFSNVFQKVLTRKGADPLFIIAVVHGVLAAACLPAVVVWWSVGTRTFWGNMAVVAVLTVAGNALLVAAVRVADLSVLGPINAYKAVVSLVPGFILLGEVPGRMALTGIGLIVVGSYLVVDRAAGEPGRNLLVRFFSDRGIQLRLAALVVSAVEAVYLKAALRASSPGVTFAFWAVLGFVAALAAVGLMRRGVVGREMDVARRGWRTYGALAITTGVMQFCTIVSFGGLQVGAALALFQTSTLITVLLGWRVFKEKNVVERSAGSAVMIVGAVMIVRGG